MFIVGLFPNLYSASYNVSDFRVQDFEVDELSQEYMSLHPMPSKKQPSLVEEHFQPVMEDIDETSSDSDASEEPQSSEGKILNESSKVKKRSRVPR